MSAAAVLALFAAMAIATIIIEARVHHPCPGGPHDPI